MSNKSCQLYENDVNHSQTDVKRGLCSARTQELLSTDQQNCIRPLFEQKFSIFYTTDLLVQSLCDWQTWWDFYPVPNRRRLNRNKSRNKKKKNWNRRKKNKLRLRNKIRKLKNRLTPIAAVADINGVTIAHVPPLEHTKNRYPWICSLRSVGQQASHLCGVTLLSRPPGPTVLVTSAHCTSICKSEEGRQVPNCCCPNVGPGLCSDTQDCGTNAKTVELTGDEAEVICGSWDAANDNEEDSITLSIKKIIVHPEFNISRGEENSQFVASDISVIQVDDRNFEAQSRNRNIHPACLPSHNPPTTTTAIHSGWSKPPPRDYVSSNAPQYEEFYSLFSKQWHHSMRITKCQDPLTHFWSGDPLKYPTNSFYPPGTLCATEVQGEFCPTSGESGSPLMVSDDQGRMAAEGIHSFIKARF